MQDNQVNLEEIQQILISGTLTDIRLLVAEVHQADIADALEAMNRENRITFFKKVKPEIIKEVFEEIEHPIQAELVKKLSRIKVTELIDHLDADDAADLILNIQEEDETLAENILKSLKERIEIQKLLKYEEHTAGSIMNPDFIAIPENLTVKQAILLFKKANPSDEEFVYYIYIIDDAGVLQGITNLKDLILANPTTHIETLRDENFQSVYVNIDQEEAANMISKYDLVELPVVDDNNKMIGIITVDDVVDIMREEATEDFLKLSGTTTGELDEETLLSGNIFNSAKTRLRWLMLTMVGGLLSGSILAYFTVTFKDIDLSLPIILSFIPLLIGIGGNVGNQAATIMVRGLATGHIRPHSVMKNIYREMGISIIIAFGVSISLFIITFILFKTPIYGSMIGIAILLNIILSSAFGITLPLLFNKVGIDPAIASAPFISTTIDVAGLAIYFIVLSTTLYFI